VEYDVCTITLEPGDFVLFCTDGITDAFNIHEEVFGITRIQEICEAEGHIAPAHLLGQLFVALQNFTRGREQHDDMTAAAFQYEG
jgi:serine phosphatase RsbU (regulator of sigma subunit)